MKVIENRVRMLWQCPLFGVILIGIAQAVLAAQEAPVKPRPARIEVAGVLKVIRFAEFNPFVELSNQEDQDHQSPLEHWLEAGVGARLTFSLNSFMALDAEVVGYPRFAGVPSVDTGSRVRFRFSVVLR